ncbi:hypothetical protein GALMADRAFT_48478, partial [Galerina marginata CBS 339.88]
LLKEWTSPIYVFFPKIPRIEYKESRRYHVFECGASHCKGKNGRDVRRYLNTSDARSTSNMRKHARICWGDEAVAAADATKDLAGAREVLAKSKSKLRDGLITAEFERIGKGKVTYSHRQHTKTETRWSLMKTGRPEYYLPSPETVSRDVKTVFVAIRKHLAKMLQEHEGALNFATDVWTSPNHKVYIAVTVHFEVKGVPASMLLDLLEVARSHSGLNLAAAF